jgi:phosphatidate phosphatase LPIN
MIHKSSTTDAIYDHDDDVVVDWMTMSERGTSCTEPNVGTNTTDPTSMSTHPTTNGRANRIMTRRRRREGNVQVRINGRYVPQLDMIFSSAKQRASINGVGLPGSLNLFVGGNNDETSCRFVYGNGLRPPEEAFDALLRDGNEQRTACDDDDDDDCKDRVGGGGGAILCHGRNLLRYTLLNRSGVPVATAEAHLYLWRSCDSVVVSDVDGTVTKSDIRGVIDTLLQDKFQHVHDGICKFYHEVMDAGNQIKSDPNRGVVGGDGGVVDVGRGVDVSGEVRFLYLSSRPISFVNQTRKLLVSLSQTCPSRTQRNYGLPPGPIMCHTGPLSSVLYSELVAKNIYQFKADVLARQVVLPFVAARGEEEYMPSSTTRGSRTVLFDGPPRYNIVGDVNLTSKCIDGDEAGDIQIHRSSSGGISDFSSVCDDRLFLAGFGNKMTDAMAYEMAGIDRRDIFIIDKESRIICMDGTERKDDSSRSIISDVKGVISQSDCFLAGEECCPREIDRQLSSELLVSAHDNYASSSSDVNKVAVPIHSIELSLTQERRFESLDGLENFAAATTVDVYLTSVKVKEEGGKISTSKWARAKQTIRPFSSKRNSLLRFPSFGSRSSSGGASAPSSKKIIFRGYNDPLLFARIRERMVG